VHDRVPVVGGVDLVQGDDGDAEVLEVDLAEFEGGGRGRGE